MPLLTAPQAADRANEPVGGAVVRVLAVYDGDAERSRALIELVVAEMRAALGPERYAETVLVRELDLATEPSRRRQRELCRRAEIIVSRDVHHLRRLQVPLLARTRVFTLEQLAFTLELVANAPGAHRIVSILDRGCAAFSRSVIAAACAGRGLVPSLLLGRRRAESVDDYIPRIGRALHELVVGGVFAR